VTTTPKHSTRCSLSGRMLLILLTAALGSPLRPPCGNHSSVNSVCSTSSGLSRLEPIRGSRSCSRAPVTLWPVLRAPVLLADGSCGKRCVTAARVHNAYATAWGRKSIFLSPPWLWPLRLVHLPSSPPRPTGPSVQKRRPKARRASYCKKEALKREREVAERGAQQ
jgi:hypothetical protein